MVQNYVHVKDCVHIQVSRICVLSEAQSMGNVDSRHYECCHLQRAAPEPKIHTPASARKILGYRGEIKHRP